ncbi:MAG: hypothetical protein PHP88_06935 [bacterium]|nr:hypothetical protein [bacterium]
MPTSRSMTPHRVLPFMLTIPLLLMFVAVSPAAVDTGFVPIHLQSVPRGFHSAPVPAPWEDDIYTDGIPPGSAGDDLSRRKARPSRIIPRDERMGRRLPLRTGTVDPRLVLIETLLDAFLIGLPPPVMGPGA